MVLSSRPMAVKLRSNLPAAGHYEVWMCRSDGSGLIQLTHFNSLSGTPRWSPDGHQIVFDSPMPAMQTFISSILRAALLEGSPVNHRAKPYRVGLETGVGYISRQIAVANWRYGRCRQQEVLAVQVTRHGGFAALESPDGRFLYYAKGLTVPGLWRIPTNGGEESEIISSLEPGYWGYWAVVENGIYYLDMKRSLESISSTSPPIALSECSILRTVPLRGRRDWQFLQTKDDPLHTAGRTK